MQNSDQYLIVGRFLGPHGLKGWIKVFSHTDPVENLGRYRPVWIKRNDQWQSIDRLQVKRQGKGLIAKLPGCDTPEATQAFSGLDIAIQASQRASLPDGDFYWSDLEGLQVETVAGEVLGRISHLFETGSNDVLVVEPEPGSLDDRQRLIPYLPEQVVVEVDLVTGKLKVDWDSDF